MPENLRITTPVPNSDGVIKPNPSAQTPLVEPMDPARVNRPNTQDQNANSSSLNLLLSRDSVFGKFIQQIRQTPLLTETLEKILFSTIRQLKANPDSFSEDSALRELVSVLYKEQGELVDDLMLQEKNSTLFSGPLFEHLNRVSEQAGDLQLDLRIASFLKAFDGFSSVKETTKSILSNLDNIGKNIPSNDARQLALLCEKLNTEDPAGNISHNLNVLKNEIIPFLSAYVSKSSDYGKMRETISLLLQNISILNISTRDNLEAKFLDLVRYCERHTTEPQLNLMRSFFEDAVKNNSEKEQSNILHSLLHLLSKASSGEASEADRTMYGDICRSLLLDNSVYMPFTHLVLPAVLQGKFLFSQIWIEKKDDKEESSIRPTAAESPTRLYLTFDIQDLGYFEARIELTGKKIDLSLSCPEKLLGQSRAITASLAQILTKNGLSFGDIRLSRCEKPTIPDLIVQKIMERRQAVNVSV
ncbi:MAG: Flg-hook domain-containing protein [Oscillospiraceae bacterium]